MFFFFFFNDTATTEIYTLSLHDALPICHPARLARRRTVRNSSPGGAGAVGVRRSGGAWAGQHSTDAEHDGGRRPDRGFRVVRTRPAPRRAGPEGSRAPVAGARSLCATR